MAAEFDAAPKLAEYAHPERLVTTEWLAAHLGEPGLVVVESDEDVLLYETGHIPGAVKIDWHTDLNDPVVRDYVDGEQFAALLGSKGISRDTTVVIYGDKNNWWAAYALWVFTLFGHDDVRLLDGGRDLWIAEGRELTTVAPEVTLVEYPVVERDDRAVRAFKDDVLAHLGNPLVDVRSPEEYSGERTTAPAYPEEGALRAGHIPTAASVPWARAAAGDGTFKTRAELDAIYRDEVGLEDGDDVIAYCRIGERSSHTWFVLTHLLGFEKVRNYDGSWTEWGSAVRVPIVTGAERGELPAADGTGRGPAPRPGVGEWTRWTRRPFPRRSPRRATTSSPSRCATDCSCCSSSRTSSPSCPSATPTTPTCSSASWSASRRCSSSSRSIDGIVHLYATAPAESPTTRGFASILVQGLDGLTVRRCSTSPPTTRSRSGSARRCRRCASAA